MKSPSDIKYITLAQIVGCCLVILGHSYPFVTDVPKGMNELRSFIYTFHMPLFVWCSGYLFAYTKQTERKTLGQYVKQRTIKLIVPYFLMSLIGIVPKILASPLLNDHLTLDAIQITRAFFVPRENVWGHFWFLPMIYIMGIISFLLDSISKRKSFWIALTIMFSLLLPCKYENADWFGVNDIIHFFAYYSIGVLSARINLNVNEFVACRCVWGGVLSSIASIILFVFLPISGHPYREAMIAILMIFSIVQFCKYFTGKGNIDRNAPIAQTYQMFILSWPCQLVTGIIVERILHLSWAVFIPTVFISGIYLPVMLLKLIDIIEYKTKTKYISFIIGR